MPTFAPKKSMFVPPIAQWSWPSRTVEVLDLSVPRRLRKNRWQVEDTTLRLAGGDLGDRATTQPKYPLTDPVKSP